MRIDRSTYPLGLVMLLLSLWFFQAGCRTMNKPPSEATGIAGPVSTEAPIESSTQNLSMAGELKERRVAEYVLGPADAIAISVFGHDELALETTVSPSGKISYYFIEDVAVAGLTQFELRDIIQKELARYIKDPSVVVRITAHRSHKVFVLGQVRAPGVYYTRNDYTLLEAISAAGGITEEAYLGGAYLVRGDEILIVNFSELIEKGNMGENVPLLAQDVIFIPSNKDQKVFVLGEVMRPSSIAMGENLFLLEAIAEAGGFTHDAERGTIVVMRGNISQPQVAYIDAREMTLSANIPLHRGDIVYVSSSTFADVERAALRISNILKPLLQVMKGVILADTTVDVLQGKEVRKTITVD